MLYCDECDVSIYHQGPPLDIEIFIRVVNFLHPCVIRFLHTYFVV